MSAKKKETGAKGSSSKTERTRKNGGVAKRKGWLVAQPAQGYNGRGNPKLVLTEEAVSHICERLFAEESLRDILNDMGIKHELFWTRMRDTPAMADAINGAFEGVMTYDIQVGGRKIVSGAFDRDTAAAAEVKLKELHKRVELMARRLYGRDAGKTAPSVSVAAVIVPQKDSPGVPQVGLVIEHGEAVKPTTPEALPGAFRLLRKS